MTSWSTKTYNELILLIFPFVKFNPLVLIIVHISNIIGGCPRGVMVKTMDYRIVVNKFVLQSCYYVDFRANTIWKGMNPLILPAMG